MWPFRPPQTLPDAPARHQTTLDLIEQVTALRGQVRALDAEWLDMRNQIKKSYQRMEKANERAEKRLAKMEDVELDDLGERINQKARHGDQLYLTGFAKKLHDISGG